MRRQDTWLDLADRIGMDRREVVAVCAFLNLGRAPEWVSEQLETPLPQVLAIARSAHPLLRKPHATRRARKTGLEHCVYCGTKRGRMTRDHQVPRSRGGSNAAENMVFACHNCNSAKGARTPEEWLG